MSGAALRDTGIGQLSLALGAAGESHPRGRITVENGPATRQRPGPWPNPTRGSDMAHGICSVPNCSAKAHARDFCATHYGRWHDGRPLEGPIRHLSFGLSLAERFATKYRVDPNTGCWLWTASTAAFGYGQLEEQVDGKRKNWTAHRLSWELHIGPIPAGMLVCHRCDVPACVNPAHLFLGTYTDNNRDMFAKGRGSKPPVSVSPHPEKFICPGCGGRKSRDKTRCRACRRKAGWSRYL